MAGVSGAPGSADAVDVIFRRGRDVEVDDVRDQIDINPPRGDVCRHQHAAAAALETAQRGFALRLRAIRMNAVYLAPARGERSGEAFGAAPGASENQGARALLAFKEMEQHAESYAEQLNQAAHEVIDRKIEDHKSHDLKMFKHIQRGFSPNEEIVRKAEELKADMVVMGTYGRGGVAHFLFGSTVEQVVRTARCPVLSVRHHAFESKNPQDIKNILSHQGFSSCNEKVKDTNFFEFI